VWALSKTWWLALKNNINIVTFDLITQLHTAIASSAGTERLFSAFGLVNTKLRTRLGTEKALKLVTILKAMNKKTEKTDLIEREYWKVKLRL